MTGRTDPAAAPAHVTNRDFLHALTEGHPGTPWVTTFKEDPKSENKAKWAGRAVLEQGDIPEMADFNSYFSIATFRDPAEGRKRRNLVSSFVVVLDDIGTDDLSTLPLPPTYIIETSPHSLHVGYALQLGQKLEAVEALIRGLVASGLVSADKSGNNAVRYVRLPNGSNTKSSVIEEAGCPFPSRLGEWAPERRYGVEELATAFGVDLAARPSVPGTGRPSRFVSEGDVESALAAIDPDCEYTPWVEIGMALHSTCADWAFPLWDEWSATGTKYRGADELRDKWKGFTADGGGIGIGTLYKHAKDAGWERPVNRTVGPIPPAPPCGGAAEPPDDGGPARAVIRLRAGELAETVSAAIDGLAAANPGIYLAGGRLVRIGEPKRRDGLKRPDGAPVLVELGVPHMLDYMSRGLSIEKYSERIKAFVPADPPDRLAKLALARADSSPFPPLTGFIESPTLLPDGRQITSCGYDAESGLYLSGGPWGEPVGRVGRDAATAAADFLYTLVDTFPFLDGGDESAVVAAMMTAVYRRSLAAAPLIGITASTPATGKSLLADCVSMIATGRRAPVMGLGHDSEEAEKRLGTVLLDGDVLVSIDNIGHQLKSDMLCRVATQSVESVRQLGHSTKVQARTNVCILMTGNNLSIVGDLVRRVLLIRLNSRWERPELRPIPRDALAHMRQHRAQAIRSIITITKAFLDSGEDVDALPFGSFDEWDRMVRRPLMWAGMLDPIAPAQGMREEDHELASIGNLLQFWWDAWRGEPRFAAEIIRLAADGSGASELEDILASIMGSKERNNARALGYRFRVWQNRIVRGFRLVRFSANSTRGILWGVERVG